jgi:phosphoesterase RecJ-like protein
MIKKTDFQKTVELINKSSNVLLTTHTRPDGDACGCITAISETLTTLGKNVKILLLSELPVWYEFLFEQKPEIFNKKTTQLQLNAHKDTKLLLSQNHSIQDNWCWADLIVIVDTNTYNQLPEFDKYLKQSERAVLVIDHHVTPESSVEDRIEGNVRLIDNSAAATALIVFDLLKYAGWPITKKIAEALFVAVSTDTGWFQFDNTNSRVLQVCAELIDAGANPSRMYRDLYQNFSLQRFKLMITMLSTLELHIDGHFAVQYLTQQDFKKTGAKFSDTENLIDECRRISGVEAAALFVEQADGRIKVSLRSRNAIDVCKIAAKFGGGGHKMAAGAHLPGPIENAKKFIYQQIEQEFDEIDKKKG